MTPFIYMVKNSPGLGPISAMSAITVLTIIHIEARIGGFISSSVRRSEKRKRWFGFMLVLMSSTLGKLLSLKWACNCAEGSRVITLYAGEGI